MNVLEITDLTKRYRQNVALENLNMRLPEGKIVGLLGPNGCGKTTLIKLIAGLLAPDSGQILVGGYAPGDQAAALISYLPDKTYFDETMRVEELVGFFADFYPDFRADAARQMLADLHIDPRARLKTLSKGTREKVQLILIMSRRARLYLLDEPIAGVDPASRDYILQTILKNFEPGASIVITTHLIADVEPVLDEFVFMTYGGKILRSGVADEVREKEGKSLDELFREVFRYVG